MSMALGSFSFIPFLFESTASNPDSRHELIRPYTPRHNGKAEQPPGKSEALLQYGPFHSPADFAKQLSFLQRRSNDISM